MIILEKNLQPIKANETYYLNINDNGEILPEAEIQISENEVIIKSVPTQKTVILTINEVKSGCIINTLPIDLIEWVFYRTEKMFYIIANDIETPKKTEKNGFIIGMLTENVNGQQILKS